MSTYNGSQASNRSDGQDLIVPTEYVVEDAGHTPFRSTFSPIPARPPPADHVQHAELRDILDLDANSGPTPTQSTFSAGSNGYGRPPPSDAGSQAYYPQPSEYSRSSSQSHRDSGYGDNAPPSLRSAHYDAPPQSHRPASSLAGSHRSTLTNSTQPSVRPERTQTRVDYPVSVSQHHGPPHSSYHSAVPPSHLPLPCSPAGSVRSVSTSRTQSSVASDRTKHSTNYGVPTSQFQGSPAPSTYTLPSPAQSVKSVSTTRSGASRSSSTSSASSIKSGTSSVKTTDSHTQYAYYPERAPSVLSSSTSSSKASSMSSGAAEPHTQYAYYPERASSLASSTSSRTSSSRSLSHDHHGHGHVQAYTRSTRDTAGAQPITSTTAHIPPARMGTADVHVGDAGAYVPAGYKSLTVETKNGGFVRVVNDERNSQKSASSSSSVRYSHFTFVEGY